LVKIEFIAVVEDRRNEFKLRLGVDNSPNQYNNPMGYKLGLGLAETRILLNNRFSIILTYNYKTFTSSRTNRNKRKLTRVDIPTYYFGY